MRTISEITENNDGATIIEFAIVAPVFILLLFGIIEFSVIMYAKSTMEGATSITSRLGKTGYTEEGITRQEMLTQLLVDRAGGLMDPEEIEITTLIYENFADIGQPEPLSIDINGNQQYDASDGDAYQDINGNGQWDEDMGEAGLGGAGDIVVYKIHYPWQVKTPVMQNILENENGYFPLNTSIVVRNEPYGAQ
ncbi:MAG: pilus assembly protein [Alphaproteobacteria bacterium]|nr:pilus assembly protein [Alphaproteobacteria bacterium]